MQRFQDKLIGPVLQVHIIQHLGINGIEIQIPSTTTQNRTSWVVILRGKNRYVEELHLNDPDHNPTSSEVLMERSVVKESELFSTEMEQSSIEETYATQSKIPTNPGSGMTFFLPTNISEEMLLKPKSQNWSWDWYVFMIKKKEKLTALFIGIRWVHICGKHFGFITLMKAATKRGSSFEKYLVVHFCRSREHWWEIDSAWVDGSRRYSIQMERIPVSSRMLFWCASNPQIRTHR